MISSSESMLREIQARLQLIAGELSSLKDRVSALESKRFGFGDTGYSALLNAGARPALVTSTPGITGMTISSGDVYPGTGTVRLYDGYPSPIEDSGQDVDVSNMNVNGLAVDSLCLVVPGSGTWWLVVIDDCANLI